MIGTCIIHLKSKYFGKEYKKKKKYFYEKQTHRHREQTCD